MNQQLNLNEQAPVYENVLAGIVGAFLFSLAGGGLWYVLYMIGILAAISGLVGAICAIKGYSLFAKKESVKGIVIAVVMTLLVIVIAWYFCLSYDAYIAHQQWFEEGEIDYTITFLDALLGSHIYLSDPDIGPGYWGDLALGLLFCVVGGGSYVVNKIRNAKAAAAYRAVAAAQAAKVEQDALDQAQQEQPKADENETQE